MGRLRAGERRLLRQPRLSRHLTDVSKGGVRVVWVGIDPNDLRRYSDRNGAVGQVAVDDSVRADSHSVTDTYGTKDLRAWRNVNPVA